MLLDSAHLLPAVQALQSLIATRAGLPILQHLQVASDGRSVTLRATDTATDATFTLPCEGEPMAFCIEAKPFHAALKPLGKGMMSLVLEDGFLVVSMATRLTRIPIATLEHAESFPAVPEVNPILLASLSAPAFLAALKRATPSKDAAKLTLSCVNLHTGEHGTRVVATDGFRLSLESLSVEPTSQATILIGRDQVKQLAKLLKGAAGPLAVRVDQLDAEGSNFNRLQPIFATFTAPGLAIHLRLGQGNYPQYQKVILRELPRSVTVNRQAFADALDFVGAKSDLYNKDVRLAFSWPNLAISFTHPDTGTASTSISYSAGAAYDDFELAFNLDYLKDVCAAFKEGDICYTFKDEIGQGAWTANGSTFQAILMPVRRAL